MAYDWDVLKRWLLGRFILEKWVLSIVRSTLGNRLSDMERFHSGGSPIARWMVFVRENLSYKWIRTGNTPSGNLQMVKGKEVDFWMGCEPTAVMWWVSQCCQNSVGLAPSYDKWFCLNWNHTFRFYIIFGQTQMSATYEGWTCAFVPLKTRWNPSFRIGKSQCLYNLPMWCPSSLAKLIYQSNI